MLAPLKVGLVVAGVAGAGTAIAIPLTMTAEGQSSSSQATSVSQSSSSGSGFSSSTQSKLTSLSATCNSDSKSNISFGSEVAVTVCYEVTQTQSGGSSGSQTVIDNSEVESFLKSAWTYKTDWSKMTSNQKTVWCSQQTSSGSSMNLTKVTSGSSSSDSQNCVLQYVQPKDSGNTWLKKEQKNNDSDTQSNSYTIKVCNSNCWNGSNFPLNNSESSATAPAIEQTTNWYEMKFWNVATTSVQKK